MIKNNIKDRVSLWILLNRGVWGFIWIMLNRCLWVSVWILLNREVWVNGVGILLNRWV